MKLTIEQIIDIIDERLNDIKMYNHEGDFDEVHNKLKNLDAEIYNLVDDNLM